MTQNQRRTNKARGSVKARASHDTAPPAALVDFMMTGWREAPAKPPARVKGHARFASRRNALGQSFPGEILIIPSGHEKIRANDAPYRFRPGSDFFYMVGSIEPDSVLVLLPREQAGDHEHVLFVEANPGRSHPSFFTDRAKGELWVGPRLGVEGSLHRYAVDRCEPLADLPAFLKSIKKGPYQVRVIRGLAPDIDKAITANKGRDAELAAAVARMRLVKDEMEIASIKRACASTKRGLEDVIRRLKTANSEREVEGVFHMRARVEGNDVAFSTIAASGEHACILHWTANDGRLRKRDLLLIDCGIESNEIYAADITRTFPIGGKFSAPQRAIYDLVIEAQNAAIAAVKPGNDFMEPHRAAMRVLARGLERLGILPMSAEEALDERHQFYKRYTLHNTSHMLGLDVHDCAAAEPADYKQGKLVPGMVLTIEPGIYLQADDMTVPARYRGIGVRVEDDVLVTTRGSRLLSDVPRASDDVERWMQRIWQTT